MAKGERSGLPTAENSILDAALDALAWVSAGRIELASGCNDPPSNGNFRPDTEVVLRHKNRTFKATCEVKSRIGLQMLPALAAQFHTIEKKSGRHPLLVTEYASPKLARALIEYRIQFIDTAGNAYLDRTGLYVAIQGLRTRAKPASPQISSHLPSTVWGRGALPIIHRLLNEPAAVGMAYRDLAAASTVSIGTVHNTLNQLRQRGFLKTIGNRTRLVEPTVLFEQWVSSYPQYLRKRLTRRRYVLPDKELLGPLAERMRETLGQQSWVIGAECAAWILDGYLRPETLTLYGNGDLSVLGELLGARPAADGPIEVLQAFWAGNTSPGGHSGLADPILVYADMVYSGDPRAREAAIRIRDSHIQIESAAGG